MRRATTLFVLVLLVLINSCTDKRTPDVNASDFSFIDPIVTGKKIIFIGEVPHNYRPFEESAVSLVKHLHKHHGLRVVALEKLYGLYPLYEAASRAGDTNEKHLGALGKAIVEYNSTLPEAERILLTTIDIEHAINHSKPSTIRFIKYLAGLSADKTVTTDMSAIADKLVLLKTRTELHEFLNEVNKCFTKNISTFNSEEQDEIDFAIRLMHASVDHQLRHDLRKNDYNAWEEIRAEYFRSSIQRALVKADKLQGTLLCYVGGGHAHKTPAQKDDFPRGKWGEAEFYEREFEATKGKVASINFVKMNEKRYRHISDIRKLLERKYPDLPEYGVHYLDLHQDGGAETGFMTPAGLKFDAVLAFNLKPQPFSGPLPLAFKKMKNPLLVLSETELNQEVGNQFNRMFSQMFGGRKVNIPSTTGMDAVARTYANRVLIVHGSISSNAWLKKHSGSLPFKVEKNRIEIDTVYTGEDLQLMACYRNPGNPLSPVVIYTSYDNGIVTHPDIISFDVLKQTQNNDYVIFKQGKIIGKGKYKNWK